MYIQKLWWLFLPALLIIVAVIMVKINIYPQNNNFKINDSHSADPIITRNTAPTSKVNVHGVPVLIYHIISSDTIKGSYGFMPLSLFKAQLDYLKQEEYVTITLDDLYDHMTFGKNIPEKAIVLSFDDTNETDYTIAFPELKKRGLSGVFFTVGSKANTILWKQRLQEMHSAGMEIASHTMNHKYSGGGPSTKGKRIEVDNEQTIRYELSNSKETLENIIGSRVNYLAWPGDSYTENMINIARELGYKGLFMAKTDYTENVMEHPLSKSGFNKAGDDVFYIRRITINGSDSFDDFKAVLNDGIYPRS
ncbi:MAG: polysaccharide deacetylase family protein [bacterium]|nr:polysaccharide deacetylase family protein [bacterium]